MLLFLSKACRFDRSLNREKSGHVWVKLASPTLQATGGSDGKVLFFNSDLFTPGQLNQPCAAVQNIPAEDSVVCITWISGTVRS